MSGKKAEELQRKHDESLEEITGLVKLLVKSNQKPSGEYAPVDDGDPVLKKFCIAIEGVYSNGFKPSKKKKEPWGYIILLEEFFPPSSVVFTSINDYQEIVDDTSRARAFIRYTLIEGTLAEYLERLTRLNQLSTFYTDAALLRSAEHMERLTSVLRSLRVLTFNLNMLNVSFEDFQQPSNTIRKETSVADGSRTQTAGGSWHEAVAPVAATPATADGKRPRRRTPTSAAISEPSPKGVAAPTPAASNVPAEPLIKGESLGGGLVETTTDAWAAYRKKPAGGETAAPAKTAPIAAPNATTPNSATSTASGASMLNGSSPPKESPASALSNGTGFGAAVAPVADGKADDGEDDEDEPAAAAVATGGSNANAPLVVTSAAAKKTKKKVAKKGKKKAAAQPVSVEPPQPEDIVQVTDMGPFSVRATPKRTVPIAASVAETTPSVVTETAPAPTDATPAAVVRPAASEPVTIGGGNITANGVQDDDLPAPMPLTALLGSSPPKDNINTNTTGKPDEKNKGGFFKRFLGRGEKGSATTSGTPSPDATTPNPSPIGPGAPIATTQSASVSASGTPPVPPSASAAPDAATAGTTPAVVSTAPTAVPASEPKKAVVEASKVVLNDDDEFDYSPGQSLEEVFGAGASLLNAKRKDVRNARVPASLETGRILVLAGVEYTITNNLVAAASAAAGADAVSVEPRAPYTATTATPAKRSSTTDPRAALLTPAEPDAVEISGSVDLPASSMGGAYNPYDIFNQILEHSAKHMETVVTAAKEGAPVNPVMTRVPSVKDMYAMQQAAANSPTKDEEGGRRSRTTSSTTTATTAAPAAPATTSTAVSQPITVASTDTTTTALAGSPPRSAPAAAATSPPRGTSAGRSPPREAPAPATAAAAVTPAPPTETTTTSTDDVVVESTAPPAATSTPVIADGDTPAISTPVAAPPPTDITPVITTTTATPPPQPANPANAAAAILNNSGAAPGAGGSPGLRSQRLPSLRSGPVRALIAQQQQANRSMTPPPPDTSANPDFSVSYSGRSVVKALINGMEVSIDLNDSLDDDALLGMAFPRPPVGSGAANNGMNTSTVGGADPDASYVAAPGDRSFGVDVSKIDENVSTDHVLPLSPERGQDGGAGGVAIPVNGAGSAHHRPLTPPSPSAQAGSLPGSLPMFPPPNTTPNRLATQTPDRAGSYTPPPDFYNDYEGPVAPAVKRPASANPATTSTKPATPPALANLPTNAPDGYVPGSPTGSSATYGTRPLSDGTASTAGTRTSASSTIVGGVPPAASVTAVNNGANQKGSESPGEVEVLKRQLAETQRMLTDFMKQVSTNKLQQSVLPPSAPEPVVAQSTLTAAAAVPADPASARARPNAVMMYKDDNRPMLQGTVDGQLVAVDLTADRDTAYDDSWMAKQYPRQARAKTSATNTSGAADSPSVGNNSTTLNLSVNTSFGGNLGGISAVGNNRSRVGSEAVSSRDAEAERLNSLSDAMASTMPAASGPTLTLPGMGRGPQMLTSGALGTRNASYQPRRRSDSMGSVSSTRSNRSASTVSTAISRTTTLIGAGGPNANNKDAYVARMMKYAPMAACRSPQAYADAKAMDLLAMQFSLHQQRIPAYVPQAGVWDRARRERASTAMPGYGGASLPNTPSGNQTQFVRDGSSGMMPPSMPSPQQPVGAAYDSPLPPVMNISFDRNDRLVRHPSVAQDDYRSLPRQRTDQQTGQLAFVPSARGHAASTSVHPSAAAQQQPPPEDHSRSRARTFLPGPTSISSGGGDASGGPNREEWQPPRKKLLLFEPEPLINDPMRICFTCGRRLETGLFATKPRFCTYFARWCCTKCHLNETFWVPARLLHNFDVNLYPMSKMARDFLMQLAREPVFDVGTINPELYARVKGMGDMRAFRQQLRFITDFVSTCQKTPTDALIARIFNNRRHLVTDVEFYSMQDLVQVATGELGEFIVLAKDELLSHVKSCTFCRSRGVECTICRNPKTIFSFETHSTIQCAQCNRLYHKPCFRQSGCPNCGDGEN